MIDHRGDRSRELATPAELMIAAAARQLEGSRSVFVGIGLPNIAANLARLTFAPSLELIYEAGAYGARPPRLPVSVGDPTVVSDAAATMSMSDLFSLYLQSGRIEVGFLGASQIDRWGNLNTTVIGNYERPLVRLPGSGGACEIALNSRRVVVLMRQEHRSFVERVDFVTSPGYLAGSDSRLRAGLHFGKVSQIITNLGILGFDDVERAMRLDAVHPDVTVEMVRDATGFELLVPDDVPTTSTPTDDELAALRSLDPDRRYLR